MNNQLLVSVIIILASSSLGFSRTVGERDEDEYYSAAMAAAAAGDGNCYFKAKLHGCKKGTKLKIMTATEEDTEMPDVIIKSIRQTQACLPAQCRSLSGGTGKLSSSIEIGGEFPHYSIQADPDMLTVKSAVKFYSTKKACRRSKITKVTITCTRTSTSSNQELEMEEFNAEKLMNAAERNGDNTDIPDGMVMQEDDPTDTPDGDMMVAMMEQQQQQRDDDDGNLEDTKLEEEPTDDNNGDNNNDNSNEVELQGEGEAIKEGVTAKVQWSNWFRGTLYHYCGNRAGINWIRSGFSGHYTDRIWHISCKTVTNRNFNHCYWTGYQNSYDQPLFAQCGADYIMAGIYGVYCNSYHDRKFQLYCCRAPYKYTRHCYLSGYVNGWRGGMSYHAGAGSRVFTGAYSYHDNNQKDRIWRYNNCYY